MISHFQLSTFNFQLSVCLFTISDFVNRNCKISLKYGGKMNFKNSSFFVNFVKSRSFTLAFVFWNYIIAEINGLYAASGMEQARGEKMTLFVKHKETLNGKE